MAASITMRERFRNVAAKASCAFGSPWALATAVALVLVWAASGRYFGYSDAWQLVINTGTTIVTFLMAFLIQATQFREGKAINLKIDELLRAIEGARTGFVNVEKLSDDELEALALELRKLGRATRIAPVDATAGDVADIAAAIDTLGAPPSARPRTRAKRKVAGTPK